MLILFIFIESELFTPQKILQFAEHLYQEKDFSGALNEYRRYIFLTDTNRDEITKRIIYCLVKLQRYDEAIKQARRFKEDARQRFELGWLYFLKGDYAVSRRYLEALEIPYKREAQQLIGFSYAMDYKFLRAQEYIKLPPYQPKKKSILIGSFLGLLPGGGHFYCGRFGDGIYSFLTVGLCGLLSYYYHNSNEDMKFGIAVGAGILFYAGSIYGAVNAVRNYNHYENEKYLKAVLELNR